MNIQLRNKSMTYHSVAFILAVTTCVSLALVANPVVCGQQDSAMAQIQNHADKMVAALSSGKAEEVAGMFLANGELIDEAGTVYQGQQEITNLLTAFFAKFPGTQMKIDIESTRILGAVAIQEGNRITTGNDGSASSMRFHCVLSLTDQGWRIASLRDLGEESSASPGELLKPLAWMIGDWVNEGADARVKIAYRWSEDENFILGDIVVTKNDQVLMKSSQRIGWDPVQGAPRSWTFDSDGGFAEARWNLVDNSWVILSSATVPDGQLGTAILTITPGENGRFVMAGTNRIVGGVMESDFEISVVKQPPTAGK
jgi:uncharacterized protein (TIGR02246 family)